MQQVARYHQYTPHQNARVQLTTAPLYDLQSSPGSVESPPGVEAATVGTLPAAATSNSYSSCHYRQNSQKVSTVVTSSISEMNLQPSSRQRQNNASSAVDYSNSSSSSCSNGRLEANIGESASVAASGVSNFLPSYCLAPPSNTVTSSDVFHQGAYSSQQSLLDNQSNLALKLRMQESASCSVTTASTPEVINMLKNSTDFEGVLSSSSSSSQANNMLYSDDKILEQSTSMRDLVKVTHGQASTVTGPPGNDQQLKPYIMEPHCSSITGPPSLFQQHLGSISKDYFVMPDHDRASVSGLSNMSGSTIHHMGSGSLGDIHSAYSSLPMSALQHNQMLGPIKAEPAQLGAMMGQVTSPPMSPIDMDQQEAIKSERKRMRNRIAAHKCRRRKLERISKLEDKVANLKLHNAELNSNINMLKQQVAELKAKVLLHVNEGCDIIIDQRQLIM